MIKRMFTVTPIGAENLSSEAPTVYPERLAQALSYCRLSVCPNLCSLNNKWKRWKCTQPQRQYEGLVVEYVVSTALALAPGLKAYPRPSPVFASSPRGETRHPDTTTYMQCRSLLLCIWRFEKAKSISVLYLCFVETW
jgi:hypothetical protein